MVYKSTPPEGRGLRDLVVKKTGNRITKVLKHDDFRELLKKTPDFAFNLIPVLYTKNSGSMFPYHYLNCYEIFRGEFSDGTHYYSNCGSKRSDWDSHRADM